MGRTSRLRLAALLLTVAVTAACSSTLSGTAAPAPSALGQTIASSPPAVETSATSSAPPTSASPSAAGGSPSGPARPPSASPSPSAEPDGAVGTIGDVGIGDPYYPTSGNGGFQIDSYDLELSYDPPTNALQSTATLAGSVLSDDGLTRFDLDLQPFLKVSDVRVNDAAATFSQQDAELVITPAELLPSGSALSVVVTYGGEPGLVAGGTANLGDGGWYRTASGGALAAGEPTGASAWYPVNEHPADTATFSVTATVPNGWQVMSNGVQETKGLPDAPAGESVFRWSLAQPVASYLTTIYIDRFSVEKGKLSDGKPVVSAISPDAAGDARELARSTGPIIEELQKYFGPYPFDAAGGIFTGEQIGFALETATRPVYPGGTDSGTVIHELAHQWYGDDVTVQRWSDICLNECFASYAPWLWGADKEGEDLDALWKQQMKDLVQVPEFWSSPLVDMGPGNEFTRVYDRGPLALHALRNEIGDDAFLTLLREWPQEYGGKNATFEDLENKVNELAGRDVRPFMDAWFRGTTIPDEQYRYPGKLAG